MLPVLLDIVHDSATTPAERRQAASELAYYFLPKCPTQKKPRSRRHAADQYGFVVDPNVARELRDSKFKLACLPLSAKQLNPYAVAQKATKLHAGIKEIQDSLQCPCPSKYGLKRYIRLNGSETVIDGEIVQDRDRLNTLKKRRMDKGIFTPEEDVEETIRTARYDSFLMGPEMAARRRWAELRESKRGGDGGWGPPFKPAHHAEFRALTLLYPRSPNPEPSETFLADHPFRDLPIGKDDTLSSPKPPKRPTSTSPEPDPDKDFVEFVEIPPYCTVDRELTDKKGRLILKFTYEI